jgi:hypothetical protein
VTIVEPNWPGPPDEPYDPLTGYTWYGQPGSWFVSIHKDWQTWKDGNVTCFSDPRGGRVIAVDPVRPMAGTPVDAGKAEEKRLLGADLLPNYHRLRLRPITIVSPAAEWEFTFGPVTAMRHAVALLVPNHGQTFVVYFATDEPDFMPSRVYYDQIRASFRSGPPHPEPPPGSPPPPNGTPPPDYRSPAPSRRS